MRARLLVLLLLTPCALGAQESARHWTRLIFVDAHGAAGAGGTPPWRFAGGRTFVAVPADGAALGLVLAQASARRGRWRTDVALQAGRTVDVRAQRDHQEAGPWQFVHAASVGTQLGDNAALDIGIHPTHAGMEDWIPSRNLTYSRSLLAEFAPHRHAGVRLDWTPWRWLAAQAQVTSGWDWAGESPRARGVGLRADLKPADAVLLRGYNLITRQDGAPMRRLHGFGAQATAGRATGLIQIELGSQENSSPFGRAAHWWGYQAAGRVVLGPRAAASARFERYDDDKQIVLRTGTHAGTPNAAFRGYGESLGLDLRLTQRLEWRTELRAFQNSGVSFPGSAATAKRTTAFAVTSFAASF